MITFVLFKKKIKKIFRYKHTIETHNLNAPGEIVLFWDEHLHPKSVVDVGCGLGTFLAIFLEQGIEDVLGIDGNWVDKSILFIPEKYFMEADLEQPLHINRKFDLAISLEVAEHLKESAADNFVDNLCALSDIIIFSAAIKCQGGQNHINEQPMAYWLQKFTARGYKFYDVFRKPFWNNSKIEWWYRQNMFLVVKDSVDIQAYFPGASPLQELQEYIHPELFLQRAQQEILYRQQVTKIKTGSMPFWYYLKLLKTAIGKKIFGK